MRYIKLIVVAVFFLTSCENQCEFLIDELYNNSGRKVEVIVYKNYEPNIPFGTFSTIHKLENTQKISRTDKNCAPYSSRLDVIKLLQGDSIVIDFGDRKLRYGVKNLSSPRNIFLLARDNQNQFKFTYILTPEDYANALP